jgi:hypothetical protein
MDLSAYYNTALPVELLSQIKLSVSSHESRADGVCAMEMVAWLAGEKHSDKPQCACPAITAYVIKLNDRGPQWVRDAIRDRALKIVGTRASVNTQKKRMRIFAEAAIKAAEGVLPLFEKRRPGDDRPRKAIEAAKERLANPSKADAADAAYAAYAAYAADAASAASAADAAYAAYAVDAADAAYVASAAYAASAASAASAAYAADAASAADAAYAAYAAYAASAAYAAYAVDAADAAYVAYAAYAASAASAAYAAYARKANWQIHLDALDAALAVSDSASRP